MSTKVDLGNSIWKSINEIRDKSSITVIEAQPYLIGFIFFKFLSEKITKKVNDILKRKNIETSFEKLSDKDENFHIIKENIIEDIGYFIEYHDTYNAIVKDCDKTNQTGELINRLSSAFKNIEDSTIGIESQQDFYGLFDNIELNNNSLGKDTNEKCEKLLSLLKCINIDFSDNENRDVLGDVYEYLISKFASESGQKAGEFYTPSFVSDMLAQIVTYGYENIDYIYDPTCGSGSLLIKVKKYLKNKFKKILGQEKNTSTYNMARMNMFLHEIPYDDFTIKCGNTLEDNQFKDNASEIDLIVANPPFSTGWEPDKLKSDHRFHEYPKMAPKSCADFAFIQHMIYMLKEKGRCGVIVPHGVLFRSNAEYEIRKYLVGYKKYLRAVIGLPKNMFFNTGIEICILVFEKEESNNDILFIEASKEFIKNKKKNTMSDEHINKIIDVYKNRKEIEKFSRLVSLKEIEENDFKLNITRYIDTFEEEEEIDINLVNQQIKEIDQELIKVEKEIQDMISELVETNSDNE